MDEVKHARMCLSIASIYLGQEISPGKLPLDGDIIGSTNLPNVVHSAVVEGCIGETISAFEATLAMEKSEFSAVKNTLGIIAEDELKHAQLSWGFVSWALKQNDPLVRKAIKDGFERILRGVPIQEPPKDEVNLEKHGLLGKNAQWHCHKEACEQIISPAVKALLG
jgi:hypothetical protein